MLQLTISGFVLKHIPEKTMRGRSGEVTSYPERELLEVHFQGFVNNQWRLITGAAIGHLLVPGEAAFDRLEELMDEYPPGSVTSIRVPLLHCEKCSKTVEKLSAPRPVEVIFDDGRPPRKGVECCGEAMGHRDDPFKIRADRVWVPGRNEKDKPGYVCGFAVLYVPRETIGNRGPRTTHLPQVIPLVAIRYDGSRGPRVVHARTRAPGSKILPAGKDVHAAIFEEWKELAHAFSLGDVVNLQPRPGHYFTEVPEVRTGVEASEESLETLAAKFAGS